MTDAPTIIRAVCWRRKVHPVDVARRNPICGASALAARIEIAHRLRDELHLSLPAIGRAMGRHHTTILYYLRKDAA